VLEFEDGTEFLESAEVEVDGPGPEVVATGEGDARFPGAGEECSEDEDRGLI
jgi:hypothetical protein